MRRRGAILGAFLWLLGSFALLWHPARAEAHTGIGDTHLIGCPVWGSEAYPGGTGSGARQDCPSEHPIYNGVEFAIEAWPNWSTGSGSQTGKLSVISNLRVRKVNTATGAPANIYLCFRRVQSGVESNYCPNTLQYLSGEVTNPNGTGSATLRNREVKSDDNGASWYLYSDSPYLYWWFDTSNTGANRGAPPAAWTNCAITGATTNWGGKPQAGKDYTLSFTSTGNISKVELDINNDGAAEQTITSGSSFTFQFPAAGTYDWRIKCYDQAGTGVVSTWGADGLVVRQADYEEAGLGACFKSDSFWDVLNPRTYVEASACLFRWAFIPDQATIDSAKDLWGDVSTKAPFSWAVEVTTMPGDFLHDFAAVSPSRYEDGTTNPYHGVCGRGFGGLNGTLGGNPIIIDGGGPGDNYVCNNGMTNSEVNPSATAFASTPALKYLRTFVFGMFVVALALAVFTLVRKVISS